MKMKAINRVFYEAPKINIIDIGIEGVLCQSPGPQQESQGNFSYSKDTDHTWD